MKPKILLVEDDVVLATSLSKYLQLNGYDVDVAKSYYEAGDKTYENKYDLYIFDINLKDGSGIELLEDLRFAEDNTPTIFISALRDTKTVVKGFNAGAEDYIKKPFDPEELLVRIKARLNSKRVNEKPQEEEIKYKDITIKGNTVLKNGKVIELGEVQLSILKTLLKNKGRIVPKENLYNVMHHPSSLALRVNISKLKKKTGINIKSVRGLGYLIEDEE
jgi:DNA-binding response OmpR family regulator